MTRLPSPIRRGPILLALILALLAVAPVAAQRGMTIVDLIEVPRLGDPQLSPDGRHVLYTRSEADWAANRTRTQVWRIGADGTEALQLTRGESDARSPRWSPDGRQIAFLTERGEDDDAQIYLLDTRGGEARRLTEHPSSVGSITWSPDGRWIYFSATEPKSEEQRKREDARDDVYAFDEDWRHRHVWRADVATGGTERITGGEFSVVDYSLSPDGTMLAVVRGPTPILNDLRRREVYVLPARPGAEMRQVTSNDVPESGPRLSPDNRQLLFVVDANEAFESYYNDKIFLVSVDGGAPGVLLPELPHEVNGAEWARDGRAILFRANTGVRQELFRVALSDRSTRQLTEGDHAVGSWMYEPSQDRLVFTISTPTNPGDVWSLNADGRSLRRVTDAYGDLDRFRHPRVEVVRWPGEDGVEVEGLLWYPLDHVDGRRYPLVVQTHGGPAASDKLSFPGSGDYVQKLADLGYFVFQPNYRGSTGYGDDFLRDMVPGYFNQAHKDVMTGVDHLIARGLVDGDRMAKMGWSGGGHMTNKIITYTDRFRAASSGAGAGNWVSMYGQSDVRYYRTPWFGGTPWQENAPMEMYWEHSPLADVWRVSTPTLFLVGERDDRVPMPQSVEMYRALRANGVPTHLYVAPREPHGWRELRHRLFKANVELDWFERWVRDREYSWETVPEAGAPATAADADQGPESDAS